MEDTLTVRLTSSGVICTLVSAEGKVEQVEDLFAKPEPKKEKYRRYSVYIGKKHVFDSSNAVGERLSMAIAEGFPLYAITIRDKQANKLGRLVQAGADSFAVEWSTWGQV